MLTLLKKPCLNGLPGTTVLTDEIRKELNINEKLLKLDAKQWSETKALVDDYFENHQLDFQSIGKNVLRSILEVLLTISNYKYIEGNRHLIAQPLQEYSYKVYKYLRQTHLQEEFERFFKLKEVEARKNLQELYAEKEGEVVEHALERRTLVRIGKRTEREIDAEKENIAPCNINIVKTSKSFKIHHPEALISTPNTPRLQKEDYETLDPTFNIKLRTTMQQSTTDIEAIYEQARIDEKNNASLQKIPGAVELLKETVLSDDKAFLNKHLWGKDDTSPFIDSMKYIISDYYQNCLVQTPYNFEDERTFFCEVIIPILKTFAIHNTNMTFKWCEKQSKENRSTWLQNSDYKPKNVERRLLDGYGLSENKGIAVLIESSGSESKVAHSVEDSIKQIKSSTDFLSYLKGRFKYSFAKTFTNLNTPSLLLIRDQLTLTTTSLNYNKKWQIIDVRTATVPTTKEGKYNLVKVFELLAHLKEIWDDQQKIVSQLEAEAVGFGGAFEKTVEEHFQHQ